MGREYVHAEGQALPSSFFIGQISHVIRISLLVHITENYDLIRFHHLDF
jgi:hypothetical protein